ncbi:pyroglutamyl-peptidase I [Acetonema longum]|uniref:Pyrrolidone-carboxylate peptidase n=1 Tax=Acetonema longum DSM 6540 TaxID=1009370 RepID=F7NGN8_9FIRM|nr:pyroglutamyl-peptidase I [Acetonema longum]EGO64842.1 pyrrolidone-carboxylate peptidase [Acetonema longum DSM 6540]
MKKILATGFEPFGGESINPALEAVKQLDGRIIAGHQIITRALPVVQKKSIAAVSGSIRELQPALVLAIGQAGGRPEISVERVAINIDDYRIPDNEGNQPVDAPIVSAAPAAYWSTLPIKAMVERMRRNGIPAGISNSAGTFVCNHLFYGLMHYLHQGGNQIRGGFIHIPYLPEQAARNPGQPSMGLETIVRGLMLALEAALETGEDIKMGAGKIH